MASATGALLAQRAQERQDKKNELVSARNSNIQQYVQRMSAEPRTVGTSNRLLPAQSQAQPERQSSRLVQEMSAMSAKLNNPKATTEDKQKEQREERDNDLRVKREEKHQEENNRNFDALGGVFKGQTGKIVDALEDLKRQLKQQSSSSGGGGGGSSLLDQLLQEREKQKRRSNQRAPSGGGGGSSGGDQFDIPDFDDANTTAEDKKKAKRERRMKRLRGGKKGFWNKARGFGESVLESGSNLVNKGAGIMEGVVGKTGMKVLGHVGTGLAVADAAYNAVPQIGTVLDDKADTADRLKAGAHLAVSGAGATIGGILGGTTGAAMGADLGNSAVDAADWVGQKLADNIDVYDMINDPKGPLQTALGSVKTGYDAIVDSSFGKALGFEAAVAMAPFSEDARKALKDDWNNEILPSFESKFDVLTNAMGNYGAALSKAGGDILDGLKNAGGNVVDGFKDAGNAIVDGYKKNGVLGAMQAVKGTASQVWNGIKNGASSAADGVANAGSSLRYGAEKGTANSLDLALGFSAKKGFKGMNDSESKAYAGNVMKTESGGAVGITNQFGFAGQYQFGADALADNGLIDKDKLAAAKKAAGGDWYKGGMHKKFMEDNSNWTNEGGRDAFLKDKQLQDDTFVSYTNKNIDAGYKSGALTANSSAADIAAYAKAAHLKGAGGANDYFLRGKDSTDANGMSVSQYANDAKTNLNDLTAKVDAAKSSGVLAQKVAQADADKKKAAGNAPVVAKADAKKPSVVGQVASAKKEAEAPAADAPTLKEQMELPESPWSATTRNIAEADRKREAQAKATPVGTVPNSPDSTGALTATASAQAQPMVSKDTPAETQRVMVANPTPQSEASKNTIVQNGGGGSSSTPSLDEIPMYINDMGLVLLNMGHV